MKAVVIGSNSFSGSHFIAHCLENGLEVVGISRSPELPAVFLPYKWAKHNGFTFHELDLNRDLDAVMRVIRDFRSDYVVNFAAQGMVAQSWNAPADWFMTNTVAMVNLHDQLRHCEFLKKFVQVSTPEIYGHTTGNVTEAAPYNPSTPYATSKAACDMSLLAFHKAYNFPVTFTRAANVCGPGQQLYRIIPRAIFCILTGEKLKLEGGGTSVRSFVHIRDICDATLRVACGGRSGEIYHLSTDRRVSIRELVEMICRALGEPFEKHVELAPARLAQDGAYSLDWTKARKELDWQPWSSLESTIEETIAWVRDNLAELKRQPRDYIHKP